MIPSPLPAEREDPPVPALDADPRELGEEDLVRRVLVASAAGRRAETLAGSALERLHEGPPKDAPGDDGEAREDWSLARACPPTLTGFAEIHAGFSPGDTAAARGLSRALVAMPQLDEAARDGTLKPTGLRMLARKGKPSMIGEWIAV